jgi:proteasome accessory factor A
MEERTIEAARPPLIIGSDSECGNFLLGLERHGGTAPEASRALLARFEGFPRPSGRGAAGLAAPWSAGGHASSLGYYERDASREEGVGAGYDAQDWGRKYLASNGGCVYIDLNHLEICTPEVRSAWDFVAVLHAMFCLLQAAQQAANARLPRGCRTQVHLNNTDGMGSSYGSHLNFLITRRAWENLFSRKLHHLLWLASYMASSIVFTGQGKAGSENGEAPLPFQLSQRADFVMTLVGPQTTFNRPLVNSRDEPLCGREERDGLARLHAIFFDQTLCHTSTLLKAGVMQILLAQAEAEHVDSRLILDDPIDALKRWSRDPSLAARARTAAGRNLTAVEMQMLFLENARRFAGRGGFEEVVPRAAEILDLWEDTLLKLRSGDMVALTRRLDWALKRSLLERALERRPELTWESPQIKHLDQMYSSLDAGEGLYWAYERQGAVERVATPAQIEWFTTHPPEDTRAWTRAMLLRAADPQVVDDVGWDFIRFRFRDGYWHTYHRLELAHPAAFTRAQAEPAFAENQRLDALLDTLELLPHTEREIREGKPVHSELEGSPQ